MNLQLRGTAALTTLLLASSSFAQTNFPETEPNSQKTEATPVVGIVNNDTITGLSTGTTTTLGLTTDDTVDMYRVKTGLLAAGIYKHRLTLTTTGTAGHAGSLRGLTQTGTVGVGGTIGTGDSEFQLSSTTTTPARFNQWYGFGKQEEMYYRVVGGATTTSAYVATLTTTTVVPTPVAGVFVSGPVTITDVGQTTADTEIHLYDGGFNAIVGGLNDDTFQGAFGTSTLRRCLDPGTYYFTISAFNTSNNLPAAADDDWVTFAVLDFPDSLASSNSSTLTADWDFTVTDGTTTTVVTNQLPAGSPYDVTWYSMTVNPAPAPANDNCGSATVVLAGTTTGNLSAATNDGVATCDPGGAASKDVWYSFANGLSASTLSLSTCGSTGVDTVLTVYSSCGVEIAGSCNDTCSGSPCGGPSACVSTALAASQTVLIRVSDKGLGGGCFTLNVTNVPVPPANDDCNTPIVLAGPGVYPFDTTSATTGTQGQGTTIGCGSSVKFDLWYTYMATTNGTATVTTCGLTAAPPNHDSKIAIYSGAGCPAGLGIACNDDNCGLPLVGFNSTVNFPTVCGTTYTIQLGRFGAATVPVFGTFQVSEVGTACATPTVSYCSGDGTDTACPCANPGLPGRGCDNTVSSGGAGLTSSGIASISADTLVLSGNNAVPNGPGLYYQGSTPALAGPPFGVTFGHGLRCAGGATPRLEIRIADGAGASSTTVPINVLGSTAAGDVRYYQLWYRDSPLFGTCTIGFNLSSALSLTWAP